MLRPIPPRLIAGPGAQKATLRPSTRYRFAAVVVAVEQEVRARARTVSGAQLDRALTNATEHYQRVYRFCALGPVATNIGVADGTVDTDDERRRGREDPPSRPVVRADVVSDRLE